MNKPTNLNESTFSSAITDIITTLWENIPEAEKDQFFQKAFDYLSGEGALEVWEAIKKGLEDRVLTEEDKEALVRKLNINPKLLDGADTVFTVVSLILEATPIVLGKIWDVLQLGPVDEAVGAVPVVGPILAAITAVLSFLPDGQIVGLLASVGIHIKMSMAKWLKNIIIHKVIPEPEEIKTFESALAESINSKNLTEGFAAEFRLYETLWD